MELDHLPASLLVLGGGYVAMEMAQLFAHLGTEVTVLARSRLARREEPELADGIRDAFIAEGIAVIEGARPTEVRRDGDQVVVVTGDDGDFRADRLLVATGRRPRTRGLGLEKVGVELGPDGEVVVDADSSTSNPRIWAAGDVTGHPQFVYVAAKQGAIAVENAFQESGRRIDYAALPRIAFTNPTIASAGITEAQAHEQGIDCDCRVLGLDNVPRAIVSRNTRGVVKLVAERETCRVLGVHLLAEGAGDAILAGVHAIEAHRTVTDLADGWGPYLTIVTLFLPALLGQAAHVESTCPVTATEARLTVAPDGVRAAEPASLQVSFPALASTVTSDITASFCCHVHFLAGQDAADAWLADNPGALTLSLEDALELGRLATQPLLEDGRR